MNILWNNAKKKNHNRNIYYYSSNSCKGISFRPVLLSQSCKGEGTKSIKENDPRHQGNVFRCFIKIGPVSNCVFEKK